MIGQPVTASNSHPNGCNLERRRKRVVIVWLLILTLALNTLLKLQSDCSRAVWISICEISRLERLGRYVRWRSTQLASLAALTKKIKIF